MIIGLAPEGQRGGAGRAREAEGAGRAGGPLGVHCHHRRSGATRPRTLHLGCPSPVRCNGRNGCATCTCRSTRRSALGHGGTSGRGGDRAHGMSCGARARDSGSESRRCNVRRQVRAHLLARDGPLYEGDITPWWGQHRSPLRGMHPGAQLLRCDRQDGVATRGGSGGNRGVVEDEGLESVRSAFGLGTRLASSRGSLCPSTDVPRPSAKGLECVHVLANDEHGWRGASVAGSHLRLR